MTCHHKVAPLNRGRVSDPAQAASSGSQKNAPGSAGGYLLVETVILLSASKQADGGKVLRAAAQAYKVDTDAIALKVKHDFAAKEKAKVERKPQAVDKPARKRVA